MFLKIRYFVSFNATVHTWVHSTQMTNSRSANVRNRETRLRTELLNFEIEVDTQLSIKEGGRIGTIALSPRSKKKKSGLLVGMP